MDSKHNAQGWETAMKQRDGEQIFGERARGPRL